MHERAENDPARAGPGSTAARQGGAARSLPGHLGRKAGIALALGLALFVADGALTWRETLRAFASSGAALRAREIRRGLAEVAGDVEAVRRAVEAHAADPDPSTALRAAASSARLSRDATGLLAPDGGGRVLAASVREIAELAASLHADVQRAVRRCREGACAGSQAPGPQPVDALGARVDAAAAAADAEVVRQERESRAREAAARRAFAFDASFGSALLALALAFVIAQAMRGDRAVRALAESEARLRTVVRTMGDGLALRDARGRVELWNPAMERLTGLSADEARRMPDVLARLHPEPGERAQAAQGAAAALDRGSDRRELAIADGAGERRDVLVSSAVVEHAGGRLLLSTYHDVTDRRRAERERENLIQQLQHALSDVKTLRGLLPICGWCKQIRDDQGYYHRIEAYISAHSEARFTHGICPDCARQLERDLAREG